MVQLQKFAGLLHGNVILGRGTTPWILSKNISAFRLMARAYLKV